MTLWTDLGQRQERQNLRKRGIDEVAILITDNSSDNRGKHKGIRVQLDEIRKREAERVGRKITPLIEKGCSDHIAALSMKDLGTSHRREGERMAVREAPST